MKLFFYFLVFVFSFVGTAFSDVHYVKTPADGGDDAHDGLSWANAEATISAAVAAAAAGDYVFVKYGTYSITSNLTKAIGNYFYFTSDDGTHTTWDTAVPDSSQCIIQGSGCRIFYFRSLSNTLKIRGFKITNGDATSASNYPRNGGALYIYGNAVIENCWITNNVASTDLSNRGYGGGMYFCGGSPEPTDTIKNCRIDFNTASNQYTGDGGAIYISNQLNVVIVNNILDNNIASLNNSGTGGAIYCEDVCTIRSNIFSNNYASKSNNASHLSCYGGAIMNWYGSTITNNVFYKNADRINSTSSYGSAIDNSSAGAVIKNNIFHSHNINGGSNNTAVYTDAAITIANNSFYNNSSKYNAAKVTSNNEVTTDPKFTNAAGGDFTLQSTSPCIDNGDTSFSVPEGGEPTIDIGAIEYVNTADKSLTNIDNSINDNLALGSAIALASESGVTSAHVQQYTDDPPNSPGGSKHIGKYWNVSSISGSNAKLRLYFCSEAVASFTGTPTIYHYTGSAWESLPTEAAVTVGCCKYVETTNYYSSFSNVTVGDGNAPLPVELTSFAANIQNNVVNLVWSTATEVNNYGFEVQRTIKNSKFEIQNWASVGFVKGNGNSNSTKEYSFDDKNISNGKYSYRLKQIDNDGSFKYSKEVVVEINKPAGFSLAQNYPNPFNPSTTITFSIPEDNHVILKLYDILGREVKTLINENRKAGTHTLSFNAGGLSNGVYIYKIAAGKYSDVRKMLLLK